MRGRDAPLSRPVPRDHAFGGVPAQGPVGAIVRVQARIDATGLADVEFADRIFKDIHPKHKPHLEEVGSRGRARSCISLSWRCLSQHFRQYSSLFACIATYLSALFADTFADTLLTVVMRLRDALAAIACGPDFSSQARQIGRRVGLRRRLAARCLGLQTGHQARLAVAPGLAIYPSFGPFPSLSC